MKLILIKLVLILPILGQLYLSFRFFDKGDTVGGIIYLLVAIVWSMVALNINKIAKK